MSDGGIWGRMSGRSVLLGRVEEAGSAGLYLVPEGGQAPAVQVHMAWWDTRSEARPVPQQAAESAPRSGQAVPRTFTQPLIGASDSPFGLADVDTHTAIDFREKENSLDSPGEQILRRFAVNIARAAVALYRGRFPVIEVQVEGGGNGGFLKDAVAKGRERANVVRDFLASILVDELTRRYIPVEAVVLQVRSRGTEPTESPFGQSQQLEARARRRQTLLWLVRHSEVPVRPVLRYDVSPNSWPPHEELTAELSFDGARGGVFIVSGRDGSKLVVKPMYSDGPEVYYAGNFIREVGGLETARVRVYDAGSGEGHVLRWLLNDSDLYRGTEGMSREVRHFLVFEFINGQEELVGDEVENFLNDGKALAYFGRLMVVDAFLGYGDRSIQVITDEDGLMLYLRNIIYDSRRGIVAIDNGSTRLTEDDYNAGLSGDRRKLLRRFRRNDFLDSIPIVDFLSQINVAHSSQGRHGFLPDERLRRRLKAMLPSVRAQISMGVNAALSEIADRALERDAELRQEQFNLFPETFRFAPDPWHVGPAAAYVRGHFQNLGFNRPPVSRDEEITSSQSWPRGRALGLGRVDDPVALRLPVGATIVVRPDSGYDFRVDGRRRVVREVPAVPDVVVSGFHRFERGFDAGTSSGRAWVSYAVVVDGDRSEIRLGDGRANARVVPGSGWYRHGALFLHPGERPGDAEAGVEPVLAGGSGWVLFADTGWIGQIEPVNAAEMFAGSDLPGNFRPRPESRYRITGAGSGLYLVPEGGQGPAVRLAWRETLSEAGPAGQRAAESAPRPGRAVGPAHDMPGDPVALVERLGEGDDLLARAVRGLPVLARALWEVGDLEGLVPRLRQADVLLRVLLDRRMYVLQTRQAYFEVFEQLEVLGGLSVEELAERFPRAAPAELSDADRAEARAFNVWADKRPERDGHAGGLRNLATDIVRAHEISVPPWAGGGGLRESEVSGAPHGRQMVWVIARYLRDHPEDYSGAHDIAGRLAHGHPLTGSLLGAGPFWKRKEGSSSQPAGSAHPRTTPAGPSAFGGVPAAADHPSVEELVSGLHASAVASAAAIARDPLGDLFGLLKDAPPPPFLAGHDYSDLSAGRSISFLRALDMVDSVPPSHEAMAPAALKDRAGLTEVVERSDEQRSPWGPNVSPLSKISTMPWILFAIWLGGPLANSGKMGRFRRTFGAASRVIKSNPLSKYRFADKVLLTDVPRSAFDEVRRAKTSRNFDSQTFADIRSMLQWAKQNEIHLVNVDELFNSDSPMRLGSFFRTEMNKQIPLGYAAASDILRLAFLHRFGGIYSDGDNLVEHLMEIPSIARSRLGYAVDGTVEKSGNAVIVATKGHPFIASALAVIEGLYGYAQSEINPFAGSSRGRKPHEFERYSVMYRTGPGALIRAKLALGKGHDPLEITGIQPGRDSAWIPEPKSSASSSSRAPRDLWGRPSPLAMSQKVTQTLVRNLLHNRPGDLYLTAVSRAIEKHPQPDLIWTAVLSFIASRPDLAKKVKRATMRRDVGGKTETVDLPPAARRLLEISSPDQELLGEYMSPARMVAPIGRSGGVGAGGGHAPAGGHGAGGSRHGGWYAPTFYADTSESLEAGLEQTIEDKQRQLKVLSAQEATADEIGRVSRQLETLRGFPRNAGARAVEGVGAPGPDTSHGPASRRRMKWRFSTHSDGVHCVEVAVLHTGRCPRS